MKQSQPQIALKDNSLVNLLPQNLPGKNFFGNQKASQN
jgi:hypothetical protein